MCVFKTEYTIRFNLFFNVIASPDKLLKPHRQIFLQATRRNCKFSNEACLKKVLVSSPVFGMEALGKIIDGSKELEWKIDDFLSVSVKDELLCRSPLFLYANESWYLAMYENHKVVKDSNGYISLYLFRRKNGSPIRLAFSLNLKTSKEKKDEQIHCDYVFQEAGGLGKGKFLRRSELLEKKLELMPSDTLTVVCTIEYYSNSIDNIGNTTRCSHCNKGFDATYVSSHQQKCLSKPIRCPTCKDVVKLRDWLDHECETARVKATEKLSDDLKILFDNKEHSDVTIKVKDEELPLHRNILAGRNPYFNLMFKTDMKEKTTGIVSIDDCEPHIFRSFIHFLYTGKVDDISLENVRDLYKAVDKYQEDQLKEECLCFMKAKMSVESFCDFIVLALKHDEKELLQHATDLFCGKTKEIIQSVKWQIFMKEYPTEANELYLKAFDYNVK